jgi:hypothetical protein
MPAGDVLYDFLARLGFEIDETGKQKWDAWIGTATKRVMAFGGGVMAAAGSVYAGVYKVAASNAELLNTAESLGIGVGKLREMNFVANLTGSSAEALQSSLRSLQGQMAGATIGQGGLVAFARLGVSIRGANGQLRDASEVLDQVGKRIKTMPRARAEMFMGQLGIDKSLYKMLTQDVSGLTNAYREMYAATGMDAQQAAEKSRSFVKEVKFLKEVFKLLAETVSLSLIGKAEKDVKSFRQTLLQNFGPVVRVIKVVIGFVLMLAGFFLGLTLRAFKLIGAIVDRFQMLDGSTQALIVSILGLAAAWKYLNLSFLATPLGLVIVALIALLALIDDYQTWKDDGDSLIDWGPWATQIDSILGELGKLMDVLGSLWGVLKGPLLDAFGELGSGAIETLAGILTVALSLITYVTSLLNGDWAAAWQSAINLAKGLWDILKGILKLSGLLSAAKGIARIFGGGGETQTAPALGPSPALAAATAGPAGGAKVELSAVNNFNIDGAGDPEAVGRTVLGGQQKVNADLVRHARGAAR